MQNKKFNVLMDLQWGSCGKGKFAPWLAEKYGVRHLSCSHRPNAGHTVRIGDKAFVLKALPSAVVLGPVRGFAMSCYLSAGSSFTAKQLAAETKEHDPHFYAIHPRAMLVTDIHREQESTLAHISSTMQGAGAALVEKISRQALGIDASAAHWLDTIHATVEHNMVLHEAAQGWELSIDHGHKYPYVTSRNCGTAAALDDMGLSPRLLGDVYGVFRPFPIRVGNFEGNSSGNTPGAETTWEKILMAAGAPKDQIQEHINRYEYTTVTKRLRRVFELDRPSLVRAVRANGVSHLILNFAQYLDWDVAGEKGSCKRSELPPRVREFVHDVEKWGLAQVRAIGTGPEHSEVIELC